MGLVSANSCSSVDEFTGRMDEDGEINARFLESRKAIDSENYRIFLMMLRSFNIQRLGIPAGEGVYTRRMFCFRIRDECWTDSKIHLPFGSAESPTISHD